MGLVKSDAQRKANQLQRKSAIAASDHEIINGPKPTTWSARMPAYAGTSLARIRSCGGYRMSKRKTPAQALEEFLSYYDESILEYRYACDKVVEEDKRLQDFLHEMEFAKDRNERNRIATSLQQSRRTRRINKDMAKMNEKLVKFFEDQKNRDTLNRLRQLLGQQRKEEEYLLGERTYKPRAGMR